MPQRASLCGQSPSGHSLCGHPPHRRSARLLGATPLVPRGEPLPRGCQSAAFADALLPAETRRSHTFDPPGTAASCTTNCIAPVIKACTCHAYAMITKCTHTARTMHAQCILPTHCMQSAQIQKNLGIESYT